MASENGVDIVEGPSHITTEIPPPVQPVKTIQIGDSVLLRLPNGDVKPQRIEKDCSVNLGKYGTFYANDLVGQHFGLTYDIVDKKLKLAPPRILQEVEDTDATNELINDGQAVQPLKLEHIEALKKAGLAASEIIQKQIDQHANYSLKTEYSKEKYKKRKEAKYSKYFTTVIPTLFNVCDYWYNKDQSRLRDIRPDTLSQILNLLNVRPGGRYIAVDDASGVVVAGILERLGGNGRLITLCDVESPPAYPVLTQMNFKKEVVSVMSSLNWATGDEDYAPLLPPTDTPSGSFKSDAQRSRIVKRRAVHSALMQAREELFGGEFDGLVVASQYEPFEILQRLSPYLGGSASIVVHSPYIQILTDLQAKLRDDPAYLAPAITEAWLRRYQVLPGRTHPLMNAAGTGGHILHTIKVYDDPSAMSVLVHRQKAKRARTEEGDVSLVTTPNIASSGEPSDSQPTPTSREQAANDPSIAEEGDTLPS